MADSPSSYQPLEEKLAQLQDDPSRLSASASPEYAQAGFPPDLVDRVQRGLDARGFYVFGRDDLAALWSETTGTPRREQLLRQFASDVGAELQSGWTPNVALFVRGTA